MCGDSTKVDDVEKLMNGEKADMVFTDPPYGMKKEKDGVLNDNLNFDDLLEFNKQWIPLTFENTKENGSWYCWGIDEPLMDIYSNILKPMQKTKQIAFRNLITWDKGSGQGQLSEEFRMYPIADEKCLFVMCGGDSVQGFCVNQDDYSENMDKVRLYLEAEIKKLKQSDKVIANALGYKDGRTVNHWWSKSQFALPTRENYEALREYGKKVLKDYDFLKKDYDFLKKDYDFLKKDYDELKKDFYAGRSYFDNTHDNMNNVWHFPKTSQEERKQTGGHATPKPIALCSRAIKSSSRENETVLDVFGGSGSTLIACEQLNRKCYTMELDEHYCDVIITRWENLTGKKAELIND
jgi:DNA modification methylase